MSTKAPEEQAIECILECSKSKHVLNKLLDQIDGRIKDADTEPLTMTDLNTINQEGRQQLMQMQVTLKKAMGYVEEIRLTHKASNIRGSITQEHQELRLSQDRFRQKILSYKLKMNKQIAKDREALLHSNSRNPRNARDRIKQSTVVMNNTQDVTFTLRRTRALMTEQIDRVSTIATVLDDEQSTLRNTNSEYQELSSSLTDTKHLLTDLERQAAADKLWIGAGLIILALSVFYVIDHRATHLIFS